MRGRNISSAEAVVAVVALVGATTATILGEISSDALVGMYGTVLGYVFGRVRNGIEHRAEEKAVQRPKPEPVEERSTSAGITVTDPVQDAPIQHTQSHVVPGTESEK